MKENLALGKSYSISVQALSKGILSDIETVNPSPSLPPIPLKAKLSNDRIFRETGEFLEIDWRDLVPKEGDGIGYYDQVRIEVRYKALKSILLFSKWTLPYYISLCLDSTTFEKVF